MRMNTQSVIALIRIVAPLVVSAFGAAGVAMDLDTVTCVLVIVAGGIVSVYTGWKNNSITKAAQEADRFMEAVKSAASEEEKQ